MGFLELRQEPGVYSQVTAGMSIRNSSLFIEVRNLSRYEGQLRNVNKAWQENTEAHGLYSLWNSPGQNTGVGRLSHLQGIFPTQVSHIAGRLFTS